jgi:hypothetical protein
MPIDRPPGLSPEEMDKLLERLANRGARLELQDPRVTAGMIWIVAAVGGIFITLCGIGITKLNTLNENVVRLIEQNAQEARTNDAQDARLSIYDNRLREVEREQYRRAQQ